jgi:hypothetical protein
MQVALDTYDRTTVYADLREEESLSNELRARAIARARALGANHVEFWRPPYGQGPDRMDGFLELARVPSAPEPERETVEPIAHRDPRFVTVPTCESVEQL